MTATHQRFLWIPGLLNFLLFSCAYAIGPADLNHPPGDRTQLRRTVMQYETKVEELQRLHGAYYEELSEELIGLGQAYKQLGRYEEAVDAFTRSLHVNHVNQGPDNPDQLPILDLIIDTNAVAGDWEALDENYDYLNWIGRRMYGEDDPRLLDVISRITRWRIKAYLTRYDSIPFKHLIKSHSLCHEAVRIIDNNYVPGDLHLINALDCIMATNSYINMYLRVASRDEYEKAQSQIDHQIGYNERKNVVYRMADIYAVNEELPVEYRVRALLRMADWCFFNRRKPRGIEYYKHAEKILAENTDDSSHVQDLFNEPAFLGSIRLPSLTEDDYEDNRIDEQYVKISFDVSRNGHARNIRIIDNGGLVDYRMKQRARTYVRWSRFRPRIIDGEPVDTRQMEMLLPASLLINGAEGKISINSPEFRQQQS